MLRCLNCVRSSDLDDSVLAVVIGLALITFLHGAAQAQMTEIGGAILDNFDDGDIADGMPATWNTDIYKINRRYDASSGDFVIERLYDPDPDRTIAYAELFDTLVSDVSFRTQAHMLERREQGATGDLLEPAISIAVRVCWPHIVHVCGDGLGDINDSDYVYIDFRHYGDAHTAQSAAFGEPEGGERIEATGILPEDEDVVMQVDAFGDDIKFWVWRPGERQPTEPLIHYTSADEPRTDPGGIQFGSVESQSVFRYVHVSDSPIVDLPGDFNSDWTLTVDDVGQLMTAIRTGQSVPLQDLDLNDRVDAEDLRIWVKELKVTWFGDANLDGEFDSGDLVAVFEAGKYEAELEATWGEGDWNADGLFDSADLVTAFQDGGYEQGPSPAVAAVPEPSALSLVGVALAGLVFLARGSKARQRPVAR